MKPTDLKLQWLWYFLDVAETRNFTHSAKNNFTSQSNISYAIRSLEQSLGVPLFIRRENDIILSKYGERLLPYVKDAFENLEKGCGALKEMVDPISGDVKIGFSFVFSLDIIPELYRYLYAHFEENSMTVRLRSVMAHVNEDMSCVEDLVLSGACDFGLTCVRAREGCSYVKLAELEHVLLVPKNHPFAQLKSVTLQQAKDEPFMLLHGQDEISTYYTRLFEYFNIKPNYVYRGNDWLTILLQVSAGRCLTIAPKGRYNDYDVVGVPLDHPMRSRDVYLATPAKRKLSSTASYTMNLIIEYFKNQASK